MTACDLYPVLPAGFDTETAFRTLNDILRFPEVTALRIPLSWKPEKTELSQLVEMLHANGVALIVETSGQLSDTAPSLLGVCDGLHVTDINSLAAARKTAGTDMQIGCLCATRDDAMKAGESGADYVAFPSGDLEIMTWWVSVMELPGVAEGIDNTAIAAKALGAGADFLAIPLELDGKDQERFSAIAALATA